MMLKPVLRGDSVAPALLVLRPGCEIDPETLDRPAEFLARHRRHETGIDPTGQLHAEADVTLQMIDDRLPDCFFRKIVDFRGGQGRKARIQERRTLGVLSHIDGQGRTRLAMT